MSVQSTVAGNVPHSSLAGWALRYAALETRAKKQQEANGLQNERENKVPGSHSCYRTAFELSHEKVKLCESIDLLFVEHTEKSPAKRAAVGLRQSLIRACHQLKERPIQFHFDVDGLNPQQIPAMGTHVPGGMILRKGHYIAEGLCTTITSLGNAILQHLGNRDPRIILSRIHSAFKVKPALLRHIVLFEECLNKIHDNLELLPVTCVALARVKMSALLSSSDSAESTVLGSLRNREMDRGSPDTYNR
ncbi:hypothetical protein L345_02977, partial [Ophiophagus hannah]